MSNVSKVLALASALVAIPAMLSSVSALAAGATPPHAIVLVCSAIGITGTNLLTLYVQAVSSDDPIALAAAESPTQPPPGIECGVALGKVLSLGHGKKSKPPGPIESKYIIQSVVPIEYSWVYTLITTND